MITLRIEHKIASYDSWKKAFDSDPINRKQSGVKRYRIYRPVDNDEFVIIDLDFDNLEQAQATQTALHKMFGMIEGKLIFGPKTQILTVAEAAEL
jgi:ribose 5-phosphate isomerase